MLRNWGALIRWVEGPLLRAHDLPGEVDRARLVYSDNAAAIG